MTASQPTFPLDPLMAPNMADGHRRVVEVQRLAVPDPRDPGTLRVVEITKMVVVRLLPDEVVPASFGADQPWGWWDRAFSRGEFDDLDRARRELEPLVRAAWEQARVKEADPPAVVDGG